MVYSCHHKQRAQKESDFMGARQPESTSNVELIRDEKGLALVGDGMIVRADFSELLPRVRQDRLGHELLVRAAKVKCASNPVAIDATAGLGEDAFLLAAAGFTVELYERDPTIAALLRDGLERAANDPASAAIVVRMHLHEQDSVSALAAIETSPDVVYLDPMFPERSKSAAVRKKMQLMQRLERPTTADDEIALVEAARAVHPRKVVIKRPVKGPWLANIKPSYSLTGTSVRYDVLV